MNSCEPEPMVLREASGVIAVLKPVGLATQAPPGIASVEAWLRGRLGLRTDGYLGVPHRLDRAVSGVVLMAATPRAARKLSRQFERREILKTYLAVVEPRPTSAAPAAADLRPGDPVEWRDFLSKVADEARSELVDPQAAGGREAITRVVALGAVPATDSCRLLQLMPVTGRMHQLRLQAASRRLPIVGDDLYGGRALAADGGRPPPILLHAWRIDYGDPDTGQRVTVEAPLPDHWPAWAQPR